MSERTYSVGDKVVHKIQSHLCAGRVGTVLDVCTDMDGRFDCYVVFGERLGCYAQFCHLDPAPKTRFERVVFDVV